MLLIYFPFERVPGPLFAAPATNPLHRLWDLVAALKLARDKAALFVSGCYRNKHDVAANRARAPT